MKVTLISPYSDITSLGIRILSAVLKQHGHDVQLLFLPHRPSETISNQQELTYTGVQLDQVTQLAQGSGLIGISVMTNYFSRAALLSTHLKKTLPSPIIWGGIHPTIRPLECLDYADYVCVGEGEEALCDFAAQVEQGQANTPILNIYHRRDQALTSPPVRPLIQDLNSLPFPDYDLDNQWVWDTTVQQMVKLAPDNLARYLDQGHISRIKNQTAYQTIATRGCPHNCSYCCNNALRELYRGQPYLRRRSLDNIIAELKTVITKFPFIKVIGFSDDSFFADTEEGIEQFAAAYQQQINLPFFCLGSPLTITRAKVQNLLKAGLFGMQMGIQTGSTATQKLYNRKVENAKVLAAAKILNEFQQDMIPPTYDFIIDNPLERTEDLLETIKLMLQLPKPRRLQLFSLVVFPETGMYHRLLQAGTITPFGPEAYDHDYHHHEATYLNVVLSLIRNNAPSSIIAVLIHPLLLNLFDRPGLVKFYQRFYQGVRYLLLKVRGQRRA